MMLLSVCLQRRARTRARGVAVLTVLAVFLGGSLFSASSVFAAGAPEWLEPPVIVKVHSTRVIIEMTLRSNLLVTTWRAEYAPMVCGGPEPSTGWQTVNEGNAGTSGGTSGSSQVNTILIGQLDLGELRAGSAPVQLRHLKADTCYDARFTADNSADKVNDKGQHEPAVAVIPFKTLPVEKPEVPKYGEVEQSLPIFSLEEEATDTTASFMAKVETNGAETKYGIEYSLPEKGGKPSPTSKSWTPFSSGSTGTVTAAEDYKIVHTSTVGLAPETTYYVRVKLSHEGEAPVYQEIYYGIGEPETFMTGTAKPTFSEVGARNITGSSAHLSAGVVPHGAETSWSFETAASESGGCPVSSSSAWKSVPGGSGTIGKAQAEAASYFEAVEVGVSVSGLSESSTYCVRVSASNIAGSGVSSVALFVTEGAPEAATLSVHRLVGGSLVLLGTLNPSSVATSAEQLMSVSGATGGTFTLSFGGNTTAPIAFDASAETVRAALGAILSEPRVEGLAGGPYTVFFGGGDAGLAEGLLSADGSGLTPSSGSTVSVSSVERGGESSDAQYWFQYVSDKKFGATGWSGAEETAREPGGLGESPHLVGATVPGLTPGEGYRFRMFAESALSAGSPAIGSEESLTVPVVPPSGGGEASCPNEAFRVGLSAVLPDCRAYEQLTPVEKGAAQEPFHYRGGENSAVGVGEDGEHAVLEAPEVDYGSAVDSGQSPYLFSRGEDGWLMKAGASQPETGIGSVTPQIYSADVTQVAFESAYSPSGHSKSPEVEYKLGPIGGPYREVASVPRVDVEEAEEKETSGSGWVAGNDDLSKLVLETRDRELLGSETGTLSGSDLYEYTPGGALQQLNVNGTGSEAATIGSCGATVVRNAHIAGRSHSVSRDGSRIFFEAAPGKDCSPGARHLYVRVGGVRTIDVGAYRFVASDPEGKRVVVENSSGAIEGYDVETETFESQPAGEVAEESELSLLGVPVWFEPTENDAFARPRYTFWTPPPSIGGQAYRYDDVEHLVECISCASSGSGEPKHDAYLGDVEGLFEGNGVLPSFTAASADGDFAFFTTISALVPQDVDGEILPEFDGGSGEYVNVGGHTSPSTDVYEWRAGGVDGCGLVQGCLALITTGRGGYLNLLLGSADEGRDVFIYTRSTLSPADKSVEGSLGEGNVYDVRVDGGFAPPPPRPTECEADACSSPPGAPNDPTPSSLTFSGTGNVLSAAVAPETSPKSKPKTKPKSRPKRKKRCGAVAKARRKCGAKAGKSGGSSGHGMARRGHTERVRAGGNGGRGVRR